MIVLGLVFLMQSFWIISNLTTLLHCGSKSSASRPNSCIGWFVWVIPCHKQSPKGSMGLGYLYVCIWLILMVNFEANIKVNCIPIPGIFSNLYLPIGLGEK